MNKESQGEKKSLVAKTIEKAKSKSPIMSFVRGVLAAISLSTAIIPNITDLSRYDFLRAFHAILIAWESVTDAVGGFIGLIPFLPVVPGWAVNATIVCSTLGPFFLSVFIEKYPQNIKSSAVKQKSFFKSQFKIFIYYFIISLIIFYFLDIGETASFLTTLLSFFFLFVLMVAVHNAFFILMAKKSIRKKKATKIISALIMVFVIFVNFSVISETNGASDSQARYWAFLIPTVLLFFIMFIFALTRKEFRKPFLTFVGFVICMEVLFWLNTPVLSNWVKIQTDEIMTK